MTEFEKLEVEQARDFLVVKSNTIIQKSRFNLSLIEQKTVAYICSLIKPIDAKDRAQGKAWQLDYEFNIRDYCKICGIDYNNGANYSYIKATLQKLSDRSFWVEMGDDDVLCRWLSKVKTNKKSGIAHIKIDEDLAPYLFNLQERFTQYGLWNVLGMKSSYSVQLYEILKSYSGIKRKEFYIDELKKILMVENVASYERFPSFRQKVLEIALEEINELTDLNVTYDTETKGRKVVKIIFSIKQKETNDRIASQWKVHDLLNKGE